MTGFEKLQEMENNYINTQHPYLLEKILLNELSSHNELKNFIASIYKDYIALKEKLDKEYTDLMGTCKQSSEITEYTIELLVYTFSDDWKRFSYLKEILNRVDKHLWNKKYKKQRKEYQEIDINDIHITEVIGRYVRVPKNLNKNMKCMLHNDKTPSFKIYTKTNSWYCFWCNKWWNAINFIAYMENCSKSEAFKTFINTYFKT